MARHVLEDLGDRGVKVLNGEDKREAFMVKPCEVSLFFKFLLINFMTTFLTIITSQFGIESTVVKIDEDTKRVLVLRRGAISVQQLKKCIRGEITRSVPSSPLKFGSPPALKETAIHIDENALKKWSLNVVTNNHHPTATDRALSPIINATHPV